MQAAEQKVAKFRRKIALALEAEFETDQIQDYEEKLSDMVGALSNYRRELIEKSLSYVADYFDDINIKLSADHFKLDTKLLKALVITSRDALKKVNCCLGSQEADVRQFLRLKLSLEEYLDLIIMHISKAGVTAEDIAKRRSTQKDSVLIKA